MFNTSKHRRRLQRDLSKARRLGLPCVPSIEHEMRLLAGNLIAAGCPRGRF